MAQTNKLIRQGEKPEFIKAARVWLSGRNYFALKGNPGISHLKTTFGREQYIEHIVYRDNEGNLLGYIQYRSVNSKEEKKGDLNLRVHPKYWCRGIGTILLENAFHLWQIDLTEQQYTKYGLKFILAYLKSHFKNEK